MIDTVKLEKRIAAAIGNSHAGSAEVGEIIDEVTQALTTATAAAERTRASSIDLIASPDASKAHEQLIAVELSRDRLVAILPRLQAKLSEALLTEQTERWHAQARLLQTRIEEVATRFRDIYPVAIRQLLDLFTACRALDAEIDQINIAAPASVGWRLRGPELVARAMPAFSTAEPSVIMVTQLFDPSDSHPIWPPAVVPFGVAMVGQLPVPTSGPHWREHLVAQAEERRREWERTTAYYAGEEEERKAREAEEAKAKVAAAERAKAAAIGRPVP